MNDITMVNDEECKKAGLNVKEVTRIARGLSRYGKQASALGITIFGGAGTGTLRMDDGNQQNLIIAYIDGDIDGGDGGTSYALDGDERSE